MDSGFDERIYWHFFTITVDYNSSHTELILNDVCLTNLSEESLTAVWISDWSLLSRIHESTAFYNFHTAGIELIMSYSSSVLLCCHGNAFVNIRCRGNKYLPSRCLAMDVYSGSTIPAFSQHVTVCFTENMHG
jgi:hypothetical protein